ncbi:MAG TPA: hypothetical protein V6D21_02660 [Candidatus Obscuribacterales bacterium]
MDDTILFHPLSKGELRYIVAIQVKRIQRLLSDQKISIELSPATLDYLADIGYDPVYGARPLKRAIQRELENHIANLLLEQKFVTEDTIYVDYEDEKLVFNHQPLIPKAKEEPLIMNVQPMRKTISDPLEMDMQPVILTTSKTAEGDDIITVETVKDE